LRYDRALGLGILAVVVLLILESTLALVFLGMPLEKYLAGFNLLEGNLFPLGLLIMALTPMASLFFIRRK